MRFLPSIVVLATLLFASVATAAPQSGEVELTERPPTLVDRLFPETPIEGEGWRGLLAIMLMNHDLDARRPVLRTERDAEPR